MYIFPTDKQQTENSVFLFLIFAVDFSKGMREGVRDEGIPVVKTS